MGKPTIIGPDLPNIPWEDRPAGSSEVMWRYSGNPIVPRDAIPTSNSIFNSAAVPFGDGFAGVFRCDDTTRACRLHAGFSDDGINWRIEPAPIDFACDIADAGEFESGYDPRVCEIDGRYYVTWCNGYHGPTIGVGWTEDFRTFHRIENAFLPYNRNGVMLPRRIAGNYAMLSRPSDTGHTAFGDIFYSESPDLEFWGRHRFVMRPTRGWQSMKVGAGPVPIGTTAGWLLIYHGVLLSCNGYVYSAGAALLDIDKPWIVTARTRPYILNPREIYECVGDVPNVAFPCAALADAATGRIAVYYGAADTVVALAFCQVDELIEFTKANSIV